MGTISLRINGSVREFEAPDDIPLLWALRDHLDLLGTKYACGIGTCGSCTVLIDGRPVRSCAVPAASLAGREIVTIEGLSPDGGHPVQRAWNDEDVPQCGYCQAGLVLGAVALLSQNPEPDDAAIDQALNGHLCRCGTHVRIRKAVKRAARYLAEGASL